VEDKVANKDVVAPIELDLIMDTSQMLEYCASFRGQLPKEKHMLHELLQKQLEVDKDLLIHKMQMEDR
jgi:hypothetical protein